MKTRWRTALIVVVGIALLSTTVGLLSRRPTSRDFCTGSPGLTLSRIEFEGQGRKATLSDRTTLEYLASLPKLGALPQGVQMTDALSFEAKLFDKWGSLGRVYVDVSTDERILGLSYYRSLLSDTSFSFMLLDSNAPAPLHRMISFLLAEHNRGKSWRATETHD